MSVNNSPNYYFNHGSPGQMIYGGPVYFQRNHLYVSPNQPLSFQGAAEHHNWHHPYQQQNPYYPQGYQPYGQNFHQHGHGAPAISQPVQQKNSQFLFQNPLHPQEEMIQNHYIPMNGYPVMNPYPKPGMMQKQSAGMQSFMNSFKSQDGSVDFNKMMNTAGQMMNAVNQVSALVKGLGGMFKV